MVSLQTVTRCGEGYCFQYEEVDRKVQHHRYFHFEIERSAPIRAATKIGFCAKGTAVHGLRYYKVAVDVISGERADYGPYVFILRNVTCNAMILWIGDYPLSRFTLCSVRIF